MKRKCSISVLAISTIPFLVLAIIPHYHHRGMACFIIELCEQDNAINDGHAHHEEIPKQNVHDHLCITKLDVIVPASEHTDDLNLSPFSLFQAFIKPPNRNHYL